MRLIDMIAQDLKRKVFRPRNNNPPDTADFFQIVVIRRNIRGKFGHGFNQQQRILQCIYPVVN